MDIHREIADQYQGLFNLMSNEHGLTLTISEMDEIINESQKVINKISCKGNYRFDPSVFMPPFRVGRSQKRAVLDANGKEVIIMPANSEEQTQMYCDYLNGL